jgi:SAM-dependent methyltransferase
VDRSRRALSFGEVAEDYDRFRPAPPEAALDWLLPEPCRDAVDVGAGTGALTRLLVARVERVTAVEPDARMRTVLVRRAPSAIVLEGRAEALPLPEAYADAVLVSSAWHWVDPERAVPEVARVLRPGGRLGLLWANLDSDVPWVGELWRSLRPPREGESPWPRVSDVTLPAGAPFGAPTPSNSSPSTRGSPGTSGSTSRSPAAAGAPSAPSPQSGWPVSGSRRGRAGARGASGCRAWQRSW